MAYSKAKLNNNGDRASPYFKPYLIGNISDKFLPTRTLLYVSVRHIFINLISFLGIPNSMRILYKTSLLTESLAVLMSIKTDALPHCILFFPPQVFDECRIWSVVELLRRNQH